jgi:uncharacterized membrane protein
MSFSITGNRPIDRAVIPGGILGLLSTWAALYYDTQSGGLPTFNVLFGLLAVIIVACLAYYLWELKGNHGFLRKATYLCMFLASFSFFSNVLLAGMLPTIAVLNWTDIIIPAVIFVVCYYIEMHSKMGTSRQEHEQQKVAATPKVERKARKVTKSVRKKVRKSRKG